jgi:hypothetical protein
MKTKVWFTRDGIPGFEETQTTGQGVVMVVANPVLPSDVIVTESEYNTLLEQYEADIETAKENGRLLGEQKRAEREVIRQAAIANLVAGTPLTQEQAEIITLSA